jgi:hypothetical protein
MHFRCPKCLVLTETGPPLAGATSVIARCPGCRRSYRISVGPAGARPDRTRYRQAEDFARRHRIDIASAYSILEGITTLEEVQARTSQAPALPRAAPAPVAPPAAAAVSPATHPVAGVEEPQELPYDPGFAAAVRDGSLTVDQATARGNRGALIARLAARHRLPIELATKLADNRVNIRQAIDEKLRHERAALPRALPSPSFGIWSFAVYSLGALILGGLLVHVMDLFGNRRPGSRDGALGPRVARAEPAPAREETAPPPAASGGAASVETDAVGQVVRIEGPDPRSVLFEFCLTGHLAGQCEPVGLMDGVPPGTTQRLGMFRNHSQEGAPLRALAIRRDVRTGRWTAGDGRHPILTRAESELPQGMKMTAVSMPSGMSRAVSGAEPLAQAGPID